MSWSTYEENKVIGIIVETMEQCKSEIREQRRRMDVDGTAVAELGKAIAELGKTYQRFKSGEPHRLNGKE